MAARHAAEAESLARSAYSPCSPTTRAPLRATLPQPFLAGGSVRGGFRHGPAPLLVPVVPVRVPVRELLDRLVELERVVEPARLPDRGRSVEPEALVDRLVERGRSEELEPEPLVERGRSERSARSARSERSERSVLPVRSVRPVPRLPVPVRLSLPARPVRAPPRLSVVRARSPPAPRPVGAPRPRPLDVPWPAPPVSELLLRCLPDRCPPARGPGLRPESPGARRWLRSGGLGMPSTLPRTRREPRIDRGSRENYSGDDLLSQGESPQVPSALAGLTSVFGMGTGVTPPLWPPETFALSRARPL